QHLIGSRQASNLPLPHHPACGSAPGGSRTWSTRTSSGVAVSLHPKLTNTNQPLLLQPRVRHPYLGGQRARQVPIAFAAERRANRAAQVRAQRQQVTHLGARTTPLFPVAHAHSTAQPLIELGDRSVVLRDAEVAHPTAQVLRKRVEPR